MCDRAMRNIDFPKYLYQIGYRLNTFSKLLANISFILQKEFGVPENCQVRVFIYFHANSTSILNFCLTYRN